MLVLRAPCGVTQGDTTYDQVSGGSQAHISQPSLQAPVCGLPTLPAPYLSLSMQWSKLSVTSISHPCSWRFMRAALSTWDHETRGRPYRVGQPPLERSHLPCRSPTFITQRQSRRCELLSSIYSPSCHPYPQNVNFGGDIVLSPSPSKPQLLFPLSPGSLLDKNFHFIQY